MPRHHQDALEVMPAEQTARTVVGSRSARPLLAAGANPDHAGSERQD